MSKLRKVLNELRTGKPRSVSTCVIDMGSSKPDTWNNRHFRLQDLIDLALLADETKLEEKPVHAFIARINGLVAWRLSDGRSGSEPSKDIPEVAADMVKKGATSIEIRS